MDTRFEVRQMDKEVKQQLETINKQINEIVGVYRYALGRAGVSENEFWVWYALIIIGGEYSQQDICENWSLSKQTVNAIVTNMVKKGYVTLEVMPCSHNKKMIRLTAEGRAYGEKVVLPFFRIEERAFGRLSDNDRLEFLTVLAKYISAFRGEVAEVYGK